MTERNTFGTKDERKMGKILDKAFSIRDRHQRLAFVESECGDNRLMFERIMADLEELDFGESASLKPVLENGDEVGNYTIIEKISQGGFASVYSAEHKILRTLAAIKIFDKLDVMEIENDMIWNKDHSSLSKFNHDNIVKLYDVGFYEKNGNRLPYIAVELVKGKHLDDYCETKDLSVREVLRLFQALCDVIGYIHDKEKILHLDLKPSNILVTAERPNRIKLIDFGSSKLFRSESQRFTRSDLLTLLSLKFAPPEQFDNDEELNDQSDVYSLGAVLYLLITEKVPFGEGEIDKNKIKQDVTNLKLQPVLPSKRVLELTEETKFGVSPAALSKLIKGDLDRIIMKSLEKRRRNRYANVSDLRQDIDNFLRGKPVKASRKTVSYRTSKSVSQFFGLRGGLTGWPKWKSALQRSAILTALLLLIGFVGTQIYGLFSVDTVPPKRLTPNSNINALIRANDEKKFGTFKGLIISCGERNCFSFLPITGGNFYMGRHPEDRTDATNRDDATVPHRDVTVKSFYFGQFEVTNYQWNLVAAMPKIYLELKPSEIPDYLPKTKISYAEAKEFCERLSADFSTQFGKKMVVRLPSEAEWEYACRAGTRLKYGTEDEFSFDYINAIYIPEDNDKEKIPEWAKILLSKVESRPISASNLVANSWGLIAMNGNVWEMTSDAWHSNYDNAFSDARSWDEINHKSPGSGEKIYVRRGGAYNGMTNTTQCFYRMQGAVSSGNEQTGFRIVLEAAGVD